jgi:two-component system C4-dicarboxylate transport sensor histidine kinase DctB
MLLAKDNDIARRVNLAFVVASLVLASLLLIGFTALQRRRRLAEQLAMKDAARQELEQRVNERTDELRAAQTDLVQATKLAALGHMSAGVSHELNQPLAAIRTYADNALTYLERGRTDTANENLQAITELADRMDRIIKNLRTYARNESISSRPVAIAQVLQSSLAILQDRINNESIEVELLGLDQPLNVMAGEVRLEQVFINIIGNALDSMKNTEKKSLTILVSQASDKVSTEIVDSGEGIPEAMIGHVLDPFYSTKPVGEGMGLGLSLTYGIVDQFGGELLIKNNIAGGASFTVILNEETT